MREQFKTVSEKIYKSDVVNVDFSHNSREAQNIINQWVSKKTMNKIKSILTNPPNPETAVIILSALYFNGEWNQHFIPEGTKKYL